MGGLGDHGGVFVSGTSGVTNSDDFAGLFAGMSSSKPGTLYLRNARPRHGRLKPSQGRPVTVCSLPDLTNLQRSKSGRQSVSGSMVTSRSAPPHVRGNGSASTGSNWFDTGEKKMSTGTHAFFK